MLGKHNHCMIFNNITGSANSIMTTLEILPGLVADLGDAFGTPNRFF
jgi:hypothetical protein